jgi:hypothetical protein
MLGPITKKDVVVFRLLSNVVYYLNNNNLKYMTVCAEQLVLAAAAVGWFSST